MEEELLGHLPAGDLGQVISPLTSKCFDLSGQGGGLKSSHYLISPRVCNGTLLGKCMGGAWLNGHVPGGPGLMNSLI